MEERGIKKRPLTAEMKQSFINYAMSVIVQRALPDVRDGLKPVQRRIVHGMNELGCYSDKPYKKSARIVGEVMGKYHPHGDSSIYEALVRMAQDFSYRYMIVDGHGNFGSIDGDGAAAQRYTEARMSKISMELVRDINKDTVNFVPNYDGEESEPEVLPARFPNLLVNGTTGIAVGMATNIPPHNLGEVVDAILAVSHNPDITILELMENYIQGPDFPTGAYILGKSAIKKAYETGNGLIIMRAKTDIIDIQSGKKAIVVTEIPYMVNKARLIEKMAEHVKEKRIEGITEIRDESNREGIRIVIELRKDVQPEVILNQLFKLTALQTTFGVNSIALVNNEPQTLNLKQMITYYLDHQEEVIKRRTAFDLKKAEDRAHILDGLKRALDQIDAIIDLIRTSRTTEIIQNRLMEEFDMSERQAKAIREMQLQRLAGLEREKIENELNDLLELIADLKDILANRERILEIIETELLQIKEKFADKRRTEIIQGTFDLEDEDLIPVEDVIISLTTNGYIKRTPVDTYKTQNRGGRGIKGMSTNEDDIVDSLINMSTHDDLLFFTNFGKVYRIKGYNVPEFGRTAKGLPVVNLLNLEKDEYVKSMISIDRNHIDEEKELYLFFVTLNGLVKKTSLEEFKNIRQSGKIAITLKDEDQLVAVKLTTNDEEILIAASNGKLIRFKENDVRPMGRTASGVKGINVDGGHVVGMTTNGEGQYIMAISENGYGKMSPIDDYRESHRGGKGVKTINTTLKTGQLVALRAVNGDEDLLIITSEGIVIRLPMEQVKMAGRNTQGVRLIKVSEGSTVSSVEVVEKSNDDEEETTEE
ncbi:MAG: DNA gyrase subunit A [Longibaculum muris]|uniref:DNA gyrase subunit A n=1 Tax=Longibaculum muris TaxID=1796628 RepID=A0A4V2W421_9FIRM|nr:DNA gyrase subunit A [Longibaculum muris]KXU49417.1 DNA gyrase, A subunit [Candidatus Stoquefichus sp. KLE1796]MBS5367891.1 DNA gyrase subunit A [Coprobacillus cateniformis]MCR1888982.1 DNA gyrase subunit A [Longibaculum muris]MED9812515.1 DNA gyrase subunit A [Longibaculum muris]TCV94229.1 DNA gyrase subunit A [Longibaculum muris]